jgi:hypothetical protein
MRSEKRFLQLEIKKSKVLNSFPLCLQLPLPTSNFPRFSEFEKGVHNFVSPKDSSVSLFANEPLIQRQAGRPNNAKSREYLFSENFVLIKNIYQFLQNIGIFTKV